MKGDLLQTGSITRTLNIYIYIYITHRQTDIFRNVKKNNLKSKIFFEVVVVNNLSSWLYKGRHSDLA